MPGDGDGLLTSVEPQVTPSAEIPMAASPQAMGVAIGQATEQLGMVAARVGYDQKIRQQHIAQIAAQDGAHAVIADDQDALHGKNGIMYQEAGIAAPKVADDYLTQRSAKVAQVRAALPSDEARRTFDLHETAQSSRVKDQLSDWQHGQVNAADAKSLQTSGELHLNEAVIGASEGDPQRRSEVINTSIAKGSMAIIDYGQRHGWDKDRTDLAVKDYSGNVVTNVVKAMVDSGDHQGAAAFYADHGEDVTGQQSVVVSHLLKVSGEQDQGYRLANDIIAKQHVDSVGKTGPADESKITLDDALNRLEAKGLTDPKVHDEAQRRIVTHFELRDKAHVDEQKQLLATAGDAIDDENNQSRTIPPSALVGMDVRTRRAAEAYAKLRLKDGEPVTDDARYQKINELMSDPTQWKAAFGTPTEPGLYDINLDRANLSPAAFRHVSDEIKAIRQKVVTRDESLSQGQVAFDVTKNLFEANQMAATAKPGTPERAQQEALQGRFLGQLHKAIGAEQIKVQRPLTPDEVQDQATKLLTTVSWVTKTQSGTFGEWLAATVPHPAFLDTESHSARAFELPGADKRVYSVDDIPAAELVKLQAGYQAAGIRKPSPGQMLQAYNDTILKAK